MVTPDEVRELALALPDAVEQDHHGRPSFRVAGRIFATLWDEGHMNVMLDEDGIRTAAHDRPDACAEFWWGRRLRAVQVGLAAADAALVAELLGDAWEQKAPRRLWGEGRCGRIAGRFGLGSDDLRAWRSSGLAPDAFADWLTDRVARRPAGRRARAVYGADDVHDFARRAILDALALRDGDRLLEVGCGGGLLLRDALRSGASVTGVDHSQEMVSLAQERAPDAEVVLGAAEQLPFAGGSFTAAAMSVVFFFLADPVAALRECRRVLAPGGRLAVYTTAPSLRGTPAAPEPLASTSHFYEAEELAALARHAGFGDVGVREEDGGQLLTAVA